MQKALSELRTLTDSDVLKLVEREPILITTEGEPRLVAQSVDSFDAMVRRLRQLEAASHREANRPRKLFLLRP